MVVLLCDLRVSLVKRNRILSVKFVSEVYTVLAVLGVNMVSEISLGYGFCRLSWFQKIIVFP